MTDNPLALTSATSAKAVNYTLRRSSDDATMEFPIQPSGKIDSAAANLFAAGAELFVTRILHDQSGNGRDLVTTAPLTT